VTSRLPTSIDPRNSDILRIDGSLLPPEPASGQGRRHGTSSSEPFDRWFRYPAGFASDYVAVLLDHLDLPPRGLIVDPFAGSAVTGTAARLANISFFGLEAHPLIAELGNLKLGMPSGSPHDLTLGAEALVERASGLLLHMAERTKDEPDLVYRSFSEEVLCKLISLRYVIKECSDEPWNLYLKWALLGTLRDVAAVRVGWPYQRPASKRKPRHADPLARFLQRVSWMVEDLAAASSLNLSDKYTGRVANSDSRCSASWDEGLDRRADGCVSSPPYLNNFDYADATRLELYFWGEVTSWSEMCSTVRSGMITSTTQQSSIGSAADALTALSPFGSVEPTICELVTQLRAERRNRRRGKEYDLVVPAYFSAMAQVLGNLANHLAEGAPVILLIGDSAPYGVHIDTPALIADMAGELGLVTVKDVVLRQRGNRWAKNPGRHSKSLSERLLMLRRA
jgi:hypothetical protein